MFSLQTLVPAACYFCTFGAELSINSILGNYYKHNFPAMSLQVSGNWAAMFGLLNGVARPLGGYISDYAYRHTGDSVWAKKIVLHTYQILTGIFLVVIGVLNPNQPRLRMFRFPIVWIARVAVSEFFAELEQSWTIRAGACWFAPK